MGEVGGLFFGQTKNDPKWNAGFDLSMCLTSTMLENKSKIEETKSDKGFRAYSSEGRGHNGAKCDMGFGRTTKNLQTQDSEVVRRQLLGKSSRCKSRS